MFFWICGIFALASVVCSVSYLSYLNWSDEMWPRLISAFGIGSVAFLVAILSTLKGSEEIVKFSTTALVDDSINRPPYLMPAGGTLPTDYLRRLMDLSSVSGDVLVEDEKLKSQYLGELLQMKMLNDLRDLQRTGTSWTKTLGVPNAQIRPGGAPVRLDDVVELKPENFSGYAANRFSTSNAAALMWQNSGLRVPAGTKVSLLTSEQPAAYFIRIEKERFFVIDIKIEPVFGDTVMVPDGATVFSSTSTSFSRFIFDVTVTSRFERITSGNWRTENYKKWASWLTTELASRNQEQKN